MRIRIYQINSELDKNSVKYSGYDDLQKLQGSADIDSGIYKNVYYGDVDAKDLEDIYQLFNSKRVPTHQGHSLSVSDVIQVLESDNERLNNKCFFCDSVGFRTVDFDTSRCQEMDGLRCIYLTPGNKPLDIKLKVDEYETLKDAVQGFVEITYPFDDTVAVVGNEEAKLEGMKGNFRIGSSIYAGPVLIVGDNGGEDFTELTPEQAERYMKRFAEPENISAEEAQTDMGITFIGFNY